ncbi:MAG: hypothetical protein HRT51_06670 [Colwellia sp.]|nr:hypothetical protein [Colwellia sp.]
MLNYIKPKCLKKLEINEAFKIPPYCYWNNDYPKPNIIKWKGSSEQSAARNLIVVLLFYFNITTKEIALRMSLTPSRIRAILKATKLKLFGHNYTPSTDILDRHLKFSKKPCSRTIRKYEGNKPEIAATFNMLNRVAVFFDHEMLLLYHNSIIFLEKTISTIDYSIYKEPIN